MGRKVIKIFILTTIIIMLLIIAMLLIYIAKFKNVDEQSSENTVTTKKTIKYEKTNILNQSLPDAAKEEVIRGIIFIGDKEDENLISSAYFVNFDKQENEISFYNFPGNMIFEVSNKIHKEISTSLADIPQVLKLSHLYKYSKNKQGLKAGMLMLEDYLSLGISHYLFLRYEDVQKIFYFNEKGDSTFLRSFVNEIINGSNKNKSEFVASVYNDKFTDIKKKAYVNILKKLKDVKTENIKFKTLKGEKFDNGVVVKKEELLQNLSSDSE
jgi:hypothetical protein